MTKDEALTLALEALEANQPINYCINNKGEKFPMMPEDPFRFERNTKAITAIKEALAQPEQEPVAWEQFYEPEKRPTTREEKIVRPGAYETLEQRYFCPRCGKRRGGDVNYIHTCTPPHDKT